MTTDEWLKSGKYLPAPLRDFHDQKDVFKAIDDTVKPDPTGVVQRPSWIDAHCYVIDVFLWYMARRGYTLQRTRRKGEYRNLAADIDACNQRRIGHLDLMLADSISKKA